MYLTLARGYDISGVRRLARVHVKFWVNQHHLGTTAIRRHPSGCAPRKDRCPAGLTCTSGWVSAHKPTGRHPTVAKAAATSAFSIVGLSAIRPNALPTKAGPVVT